MFKTKKIELTSKLVVALIAVVVASAMISAPVLAQQGGGGPTPRANSVTSATIVDGEVNTQDLANNAVTTPKIADNAVTSAKIEDGTIQEQDIAEGVIPEPGGGSGGGGVVELELHRIESQGTAVPANEVRVVVATCPDGAVAIGGGFITNPVETDVLASTSDGGEGNTWQVHVRGAPIGSGSSVIAVAHCINPTIPVQQPQQ